MDPGPIAALAQQYRLALGGTPVRGTSGDTLARGAGSSVEFHDFRAYVPGDDPRTIDWGALARTDQFIVRLHRAEVRLCIDVLIDDSLSMGLEGKGARAAELALLMAMLGRKAGARATLWSLGNAAEPWREAPERRLQSMGFQGRRTVADLFASAPPKLEPGSIRILISDFLYPHDPMRLYATLAQGASSCALIQVLSADEASPAPRGYVRFVDVETNEERQIVLNDETISRYKERLARLQTGLETVCRATHAPFVKLSVERSMNELCRESLVPAALLTPA